MKIRRKEILFFLAVAVLAATPAYADLAGWFKFDKFTGTVFSDDGGQGLKGYLGQPYTDPKSIAGPSGNATDKAIAFDGKGGLVVDDSAKKVLNILEPPITLECWVRSSVDQTSGHYGFISYGIPGGRAGGGGYKLGLLDGNLLFTLFAVVDVGTSVPFPFDGAWHHVAAVYSADDGGVYFYLDGAEMEFVAETRSMISPGANELDIGAQYTAIGRFNGDMDRVRISNAALKPAELDKDVKNVKPVVASTVAYFSFDEGALPYMSAGVEPKSTAVSLSTWVVTHAPAESTGAPTIAADSPSGAAGDTSLQFSGTQIAVVLDPKGLLNFSSGDWTLEAWVKVDPNATGDRMIIYYYGNPGHGYSLSINLASNAALQVTTLGIADLPSASAFVEFDVWTHVAVVHQAGISITFYLNGKAFDTRAYTQKTIAAQTMNLYIGGEWNGALPFYGMIDRIRISNAALTPAQMDTNLTPTNVSLWDLY